MLYVNNTHEDWIRLYDECVRLGVVDTEIEVTIGAGADESYDITNLRYLFPLAAWLYDKGIISTDEGKRLYINIIPAGKKKKDVAKNNKKAPENAGPEPYDDYARVRAFLANAVTISYIDFRFDSQHPFQYHFAELNHSRVYYGNLPPIFIAEDGAATSGAFDYRYLGENFDCREKRSKSDFPTQLERCHETLFNRISDLAKERTNDAEPEKLDKMLLRPYIKRVEELLPEMDALSQIIWMYLLRELIESKEIMLGEKGNRDDRKVSAPLFDKSRIDAVSYGQAIYQLVENACIHSEQHRAWFGMRIHRAGRGRPMSELMEEAETRERLYRKYGPCFRNQWYSCIFNADDSRLFFEFYVLNGVFDGVGMVEHYNNSCKESNKQPVSSLAELFNLTATDDEEDKEQHIQDITVHYGLPLLRRIVTVNHGYLMGSTPGTIHSGEDYNSEDKNDEGQGKTQIPGFAKEEDICRNYYAGYQVKEKGGKLPVRTYFTEFSAIMPIHHQWENTGTNHISLPEGKSIFGDMMPEARKYVLCCRCGLLLAGVAKQQNKIEDTKAYREVLNAALPISAKHELDDAIILLEIQSLSLYQMEILSKALFAWIKEAKDAGMTAPLIALITSSYIQTHEMLRLFSIFYLKGKEDMRGVQIAFCEHDADDIFRVKFILAGDDLGSAYEAAKIYAYHHAAEARDFLDLLGYLTEEPEDRDEKRNGKNLPALYPFDLFLPSAWQEEEKRYELPIDPWRDSWFLSYVKGRLNKDMRCSGNGCMLDDIHVRLGSKIHLDRFFEGEMLFHDSGDVLRFAYLLTWDILYVSRYPTGGKVLLLGYEEYSTSLILQMQHWLEQQTNIDAVYTATVYDDEEDPGQVAVRSGFDERTTTLTGIQPVIVMPVGTTLSTVYKIRNTVNRRLGQVFTNNDSDRLGRYCLILINHDLFSSDDLSGVSKRYWKGKVPEESIVELQEEMPTQRSNGIKVKYLLPADARWIEPEGCNICAHSDSAPMGTHQAGTMPGAIFSMWGARGGRFHELFPGGARRNKSEQKLNDMHIRENRNRISQLFGSLRYSHVYDENNHFQFYIDFGSFYRRNRESIDNAIRTWSVPADDFHIIVSPLQIKNSPFLKSVIDYVFHGNVRVLHLDIKNAYREEIRTRFNYIAFEFKQVCQTSPKTHLRIHFVDTTVVTGSILNRAKIFVQMLIHQAGCDESRIELFDKLFLLVNRSAYDTLRAFVKRPESDLKTYIVLAVPSYNTERDTCPACRLVNKYELLYKRSATELLGNEFERLANKHMKRSPEEYDQWFKAKVLGSHSYFNWLQQWLCVNVSDKENRIFHYITLKDDIAGNKNTDNTRQREDEEDYQKAEKVREMLRAYTDSILAELKKSPSTDKSDEKTDTAVRAVQLTDGPGDQRQHILERWAETSLKDAIEFAAGNGCTTEEIKDFSENAYYLINKHLVGSQAYMRLYALQRSHESLNEKTGAGNVHSGREQIDAAYSVMLELIADAVIDPNSRIAGRPAYRVAVLGHNVEWLISFVKILSREQIAKYYDYRQAILRIMGELIELLDIRSERIGREKSEEKLQLVLTKLRSGKKEDAAHWEPIIRTLQMIRPKKAEDYRPIFAQWEYQLTMIVLYRAADLQMHFMTDAGENAAVIRRYYRLVDRFFESVLKGQPTPEGEQKEMTAVTLKRMTFAPPPVREVVLRYLKTLKLAVMAGDDDIPCMNLIKVVENLNEAAQACRPGQDDAVRKTELQCARYIYVENIRMIYSGMRDLEESISKSKLDSIDDQFRPGEKFNEKTRAVFDLVQSRLEQCYRNLDGLAKEQDVLYQNVLGNFCRFWHSSTKTPPVSNCGKDHASSAKHISYMLQYFRRINGLISFYAQGGDVDDLPYIYEELCRIICGIASARMCYIAARVDKNIPQIFTQSGFYGKYMLDSKIVTPAKMDVIVQSAEEAWDDKPTLRGKQHEEDIFGWKEDFDVENVIDGAACLKAANGGTERFLVIRMSPHNIHAENERFYLVLQMEDEKQREKANEEEHGASKTLQLVRDILFMRRRLQEVLSRDYTTLLNYRFDCSYIRPFSYSASAKRSAKLPGILHISDLHIHEDITTLQASSCSSIVSKATSILNKIDDKLKEFGAVDLLAITGDIVDGRDANAPQMEANYGYAEKFINMLVRLLWADDEDYLPHDWRRRVMITTGNHDYAAMNQFKATVQRRTLASGTPLETESGTMSKFTYFIDFLIRFLDPPIDVLLRNDLNEIRSYRKLDVDVLLLNCSGMALPRRTNKMAVNVRIVSKMLKHSIWYDDEKRFRLCLAHYAPNYDLSYLMDEYDPLPGWTWPGQNSTNTTVNDLVSHFEAAIQETHDDLYRSKTVNTTTGGLGAQNKRPLTRSAPTQEQQIFIAEFQCMETALKDMWSGALRPSGRAGQFYNSLTQGTNPVDAARKIHKNELYQKMKDYYNWLLDVGCLNQEQVAQLASEVNDCIVMSEYDKQCFQKVKIAAGRLDLYLAGHIHEDRYNKAENVLVADKLFRDDSLDAHGYLVKLLPGSHPGGNQDYCLMSLY